ncbi:MAG: dTMP kinase, partial [Deltaproteobacteria bacterium]
MKRGVFISFEGIEGCGKSTQAKGLARKLGRLGIAHVMTLEPGGTQIGRKMRQVLLDSRNKALTPLAELMLYAADRAQHVEEIIKPALSAGKWVVCDRFSDATVVYQGAARGQDGRLIRLLNKVVTDGIRPDLTFLLDCPVEVGLGRALGRNMKGQERFEREALSFHRKVRKGYLDLARRNRKRFVVLDATVHPKEIEAKMLRRLDGLVKRNG